MATGAVFGKIEEFSSNNEDWPNYVEQLNSSKLIRLLQMSRSNRCSFLLLGLQRTSCWGVSYPQRSQETTLTRIWWKKIDRSFQSDSIRDRATLQVPWQIQTDKRINCCLCCWAASTGRICNLELRWKICCVTNLFGALKMIRCNSVYSKSRNQRARKRSSLRKDWRLRLKTCRHWRTLKQEAESPTPSPQSQDVHKVNPTGKAITCHRCGKAGHIAPKCCFKDTICYQCGKKGHLKAVCRSKRKGNAAQRKRGSYRNVRQIQEEEDDSLDEELPCIALDHVKTHNRWHCACMHDCWQEIYRDGAGYRCGCVPDVRSHIPKAVAS